MATVHVPYEAYVNGELPGVCVVSGAPTADVVLYRVDVTGQGAVAGGRLAASLDTALAAIDARRPRRVLVGRVPLDRAVQRSLARRRQAWTAVLMVTVVALIAAAWIGAAWSPATTVAAAGGAAVAAWRRRLARRALPRPSVTHDDGRVTLDGVHPAFAAAVERRGSNGSPTGGAGEPEGLV